MTEVKVYPAGYANGYYESKLENHFLIDGMVNGSIDVKPKNGRVFNGYPL